MRTSCVANHETVLWFSGGVFHHIPPLLRQRFSHSRSNPILKTTLQTGLQGSLRDLSCAHSLPSSFNIRQDCQSDSLPLKFKTSSRAPNCSERLLVPNSQIEISMSGMGLRDLSTGILIRTLIQRVGSGTWPARSPN